MESEEMNKLCNQTENNEKKMIFTLRWSKGAEFDA